MAWQTPKTTWGQAGQTVPGVDDFNRIEGNIDILGKYDRAPGYGTATGTNTKLITLSPAPSSYYEGLCFAFKNETQNTGAVTINVNGMGAKPLKKPNGNDVTAGFLKAGSIYTVRYNGTNFILQGSDSAGNATPEHVLAGKTFSNDAGTDLTGTMPNHGAKIITPSTVNQAIPAGYHNGSGYVKGDANLIAANIKKGVSIFGITGTVEPKQIQIGNKYATNYSRYKKFIRANGQETIPLNTVIVTDLTFLPDVILLGYKSRYNEWLTTDICFVDRTFYNGASGQIYMIENDLYDEIGDSVYLLKLDGNIAYVTSTGFCLPCWANGEHEWIAIKL